MARGNADDVALAMFVRYVLVARWVDQECKTGPLKNVGRKTEIERFKSWNVFGRWLLGYIGTLGLAWETARAVTVVSPAGPASHLP